MTFGIAAGLLSILVGSALPMQAFGHALNIQSIDVDGVGERGVFIVIGHTSEPTFGAYPGIHDGKHNVEVFLEDLDTALPLAGSSLTLDKYFFEDIDSFNAADSPEDADEVVEGIAMSGVFGDPGHYITRQVTTDGIYGYRLYGTVNYFSVAELDIDTTVFCSAGDEGGGGADLSKFNSDGWFGGYGCHEDIENIFFPEELKNVNDGNNGNGNGSGGGNGGGNGGGSGDKVTLTVESELADGSAFEKFVKISDESGKIVGQGFTPFEFEGEKGEKYAVEIRYDSSPEFSHWENGNDERTRTITLNKDMTIVATYAEDGAREAEESAAMTAPVAGQIQQISLSGGSASASAFTNVAAAAPSAMGVVQLLALIGIPIAGVVTAWRVKVRRENSRDNSL
jgi:hypothetical protein